jgi:hypothetical protein
MGFQKKISLLAMSIALVSVAPSFAADAAQAGSKKATVEAPKAWMNKKLSADERADLVL